MIISLWFLIILWLIYTIYRIYVNTNYVETDEAMKQIEERLDRISHLNQSASKR